MKIVDKISVKELKEMAQRMYGSLVKADVDIAKEVVIIDMEMHADGEASLIDQGSKQRDVWGINLKPELYKSPDFIEFDSMINIDPRENPSRDVLDPKIRQKITDIIDGVVHD